MPYQHFVLPIPKTAYPPEKIYDYRNTWNFIKITIIVIISKSDLGKTCVEYETAKKAGYSLVAR